MLPPVALNLTPPEPSERIEYRAHTIIVRSGLLDNKESYNKGLKDEYSRLNEYQRREFREQLRDTFQVSDRTIRRWLSPTKKGGFLGKGGRGGKNADAKANFARGLLRNPPLREGTPTRSPKD